MLKNLKQIGVIAIISLIPTLLVWLPFFLRLTEFWNIPLPARGMETIVANYDGPLYLVVAKTFYNVEAIKTNYQFPLPTEYYAAHFPLFPALIRLLAFIPIGFPYAMLLATVVSSILCLYFFYKLTGSPWLTLVFAIFPARWLIVRSIGSPEPLFVAAIIASVYYFREKKYFMAGLWGALAQLTKSPGILLFVAYAGYIFIPKLKELATRKFIPWLKSLELAAWPTLLIPIALLGIFAIYKVRYNDFLAYFHSGDNIHLFFPPFQIFNYSAPWVGTFWIEEVIFIYLFGILGLLRLAKEKENLMAWVAGIFFASTIFVSHRDLLRYSLPLIPFLFVAFKDLMEKKEFKIALAFIIIPIYLFSLAFISQNVMPISDWRPFL